MSFASMAKSLFPPLHVTGESGIHVSHYRSANVDLKMSDKGLFMSSLIKSNFPGIVYRTAMANFPGMEWIMSPQEFNDLVLVDANRFLNGMPSVATKMKLKNPKTGNVFHRVALMEDKDLVLGFRIWLLDRIDSTELGFRIRLESTQTQGAAGVKIRETAVQLVQVLEPEMVEIKEYVSKETSNKEVALEPVFAKY